MAALYIVATPIGNLKDITYRAVETLQNADLIACEDTRRSLVLLNAYGIKKPLTSYHKFNEKTAAAALLDEVGAGKDVALITDAGMPLISDPGAELVTEAARRGVQIEVIGGVTAFTHALVKSGMGGGGFCFAGFPPAGDRAKAEFYGRFSDLGMPVIFYSAPHDLKKDLAAMHKAYGARRVCIARELTKLHEEFITLLLGEEYGKEPRGEYVLVMEGAGEKLNPLCALPPEEHLNAYLAEGMDEKEAIKRTARERGVNKNEIYRIIHR